MPKQNLKDAARRALEGDSGRDHAHYVSRLTRDEGFKMIPRAFISPDPEQPRKYFDQASLEELASSIREKGILQTLTVRPNPDARGSFLIVAGERRWRAAGIAGLEELPCIIRTDPDPEEVAIIENVQREDLNPIELAESLHRLKSRHGYTDAHLAKIIGKSRQAINDSIALTQLPDPIKDQCRTSGIWSKSQLLQVLRAGSPDKIEAAFHALQTGEVSTVRELRKKTAKRVVKAGRPHHYRFEHKPAKQQCTVVVTFAKRSASRAELRAALKDALKHLP